MDLNQSVEILWDELRQGRHYPAKLSGKLSLEEGYRVQMAVLEKFIASGETHAGWKVAFTAPSSRNLFNSETPGHGYLLASAQRDNGARLNWSSMTNPTVEVELLMTLREPLTGPGVTAAQAREALGGIHPGFEILERRGKMAEDLPLGIADNILQSVYVGGKEASPAPEGFSPEDVTVEVLRNGEVFSQARGADVIDNHYGTLAFLANRLAEFGHGIKPGQLILTGSFITPTPAEPGDHWVARFEGLGESELFFD